MIFLLLFVEFFLIGLFSVGGGLATVPFLVSLSERRGWFSLSELTNIIAISEATPGPIGVNISTYVGYTVAGVPGALLATLSLTLPAFLIILLLAKLIGRLRGNPHFEAVFQGLRPAAVGLIAAVLVQLCQSTFLLPTETFALDVKSVLLFVGLSVILFTPYLRKLPVPVVLLLAAVCGIVFRMGGP